MAFDPTPILDIRAAPRGGDLAISWDSTAAAGTTYQVYLDRALAWHGTTTSCVVPHPTGPLRIDVGTVLVTEATLNLASTLPSVPGGGSRIEVEWLGGSFLGPVDRYRVYMSTTPGGAISYTTPVATVAAYPGGVHTDGWGQGGWGQGAWGSSATPYSWTSSPVTAGSWGIAVAPVDPAGNQGTAVTWTVTVVGPPRPVARNASGQRLTYTSATSGGSLNVTLNWLASPGA